MSAPHGALRPLLLACGLLAALLPAGAALAQEINKTPAPERRARLTVVLSGFRSGAGKAVVCVFAGPEGFPGETSKALRKLAVPIAGGQATAEFEGVPYGVCAVAAFHDENASGRLERNAFGAPQEGCGFSGDPPGPPTFEACRFELYGPDKTVRIGVRY